MALIQVNSDDSLLNEIRPDRKNDVICHCSGASKEKIKNLINSGADNLDKISRITGACTGCGACDTAILKLLDEPNCMSIDSPPT